MSDIEMRARGLIAAQYKHRRVSEVRRLIDPAVPLSALDYPNQRAIKAIVAAITPPEGYVLVPLEATGPMKDAVESFVIPHCYLRTGVQIADFNDRYRAMLAARPEVTGG